MLKYFDAIQVCYTFALYKMYIHVVIQYVYT